MRFESSAFALQSEPAFSAAITCAEASPPPRRHTLLANVAEAAPSIETTRDFWIGSFEFPMIDNTRLPNDQRCALMLRVLDNYPKTDPVTYELRGVCFLGSHAALKEKPYYDEVLEHLRQADSLR
jgi:hypothetical protein